MVSAAAARTAARAAARTGGEGGGEGGSEGGSEGVDEGGEGGEGGEQDAGAGERAVSKKSRLTKSFEHLHEPFDLRAKHRSAPQTQMLRVCAICSASNGLDHFGEAVKGCRRTHRHSRAFRRNPVRVQNRVATCEESTERGVRCVPPAALASA